MYLATQEGGEKSTFWDFLKIYPFESKRKKEWSQKKEQTWVGESCNNDAFG